MKTNITKEVKAYNQELQSSIDTFEKDKVLRDNLKRILFGSNIIKKEPDKISSSKYARYTLIVILSSLIITLIFMPILIIYINLFSIFSPLTFIFKLALALIPLCLALLGGSFVTIYASILREEFKELPTIKLSKLFLFEFTRIIHWLAGIFIAIAVYFIFMLF